MAKQDEVTIELKHVKEALNRMSSMCEALTNCVEALEAANRDTLKAASVKKVDDITNVEQRYRTAKASC